MVSMSWRYTKTVAILIAANTGVRYAISGSHSAWETLDYSIVALIIAAVADIVAARRAKRRLAQLDQ